MTNDLPLLVSEHSSFVMPIWSVIPFAGLLLTIGVMSALAANFPHSIEGRFWEENHNKLIVALTWAAPVFIFLFTLGAWELIFEALEEYFSFLVLLFSLFAVSGGIYLDGDLRAKPHINFGFLLVGGLLANLVGTTGASMLLIRAMLQTNSHREFTTHIPVFFILIVGNIGGCLLPVGDPPLFLGYLAGVPFFWTLNLFPPWMVAMILVLIIFYIWDTLAYRKETIEHIKEDEEAYRPLRVRGGINFLWLAGIVLAVVLVTPSRLEEFGLSEGPLMFLREYIMLGFAALSFLTSPLSGECRKGNNFTFGPILEVAFLFIGIFITMIPALVLLRESGSDLGITEPWQFFWVTGALSSVLDNAPTYLTFLSVSESLTAADPTAYTDLVAVGGNMVSEALLAAISLGSVFMGALTYIGNGPNFMIKAIANEWNYKMPDFFSYTLRYAIPVLVPVYLVVTVLFFL